MTTCTVSRSEKLPSGTFLRYTTKTWPTGAGLRQGWGIRACSVWRNHQGRPVTASLTKMTRSARDEAVDEVLRRMHEKLSAEVPRYFLEMQIALAGLGDA